jgi:hypothetical protein
MENSIDKCRNWVNLVWLVVVMPACVKTLWKKEALSTLVPRESFMEVGPNCGQSTPEYDGN